MRLLALLGFLLAAAVPALANGGTVRISRAPVGPWFVTVYSSPTPLRTGEVDVSALVQDSADGVLDVAVAVRAEVLDTVADAITAPATRDQATNKLFKAAKFDIEVPGRWRFRVRVGQVDGPGGEVEFEADVVRRTILDRPVLMAVLILLPLLVLGRLLRARDSETSLPTQP